MTSPEQSTLSILVVEDDPGVAELLRELLNDVEGWGATVAADASAARATFQQVQIDVLILDIDLPGISGPGSFHQSRPVVRTRRAASAGRAA